MINLIPSVKQLEIKESFLTKNAIFYNNLNCDERVCNALEKLPFDKDGAKLSISISGTCGEDYELSINENDISIAASGPAGAFYAIQTLRQIFKNTQIPCLYIKDAPDFEYRGFYHDVTRGKVPTVKTLKKLIDDMAYYKLNSLQLYVEHTFEFEEYKDVNEKFGYLTKEEIRELGAYCKQNFIEFIPSLSTFGHLYELLSQEKYHHLRTLKNYEETPNFWNARMAHHTIDPLNEESIAVIKSLIDQYAPNFESEYFNICCDETFDLKVFESQGLDVGKVYVDFLNKIIDYTKQKGKKVMMWADVLLQHPETIDVLPDDIYFLNWDYSANPPEATTIKLASTKRKQIVCPGTTSWSRLCEDVDIEEKNISLMAEYGHKHGAVGVLNTNWGDWANPCSIELAMYGLVLGAEKSWSVSTKVNDEFYSRINSILYENENGIQYLKMLSNIHKHVNWNSMLSNYFEYRYKTGAAHLKAIDCDICEIQKMYEELANKLCDEVWINDEYRQEMLLSAEGLCLVAEFAAKIEGQKTERKTNAHEWLGKYKRKWLEKNKPSELYRIEEAFTYCEEN